MFFGLLFLGLVWYWYLRATRPEVAARLGSIQTLSETEQQRLIDEGILDVLSHDAPPQLDRDKGKEAVAP